MRFLRRGEPASTLDLLVAGLGNPGPRHERDRHNLGWMVVDELGRRHGVSFKSKFSGRLGEARIDGRRVALLKPETYMNDSGRSIVGAVRLGGQGLCSCPCRCAMRGRRGSGVKGGPQARRVAIAVATLEAGGTAP